MPRHFLRQILLLIIFVLSAVNPEQLLAAPEDHFVTTWKTDNPGTSNSTSITIPTTGTGYSYQVDWNNDGDLLDTGESTVHTGSVTHDFGSAGIYTIRIAGEFPRIFFNNSGDKEKIVSLDQWGTQTWTNMSRAFYVVPNMAISATDVPDLSAVTNAYLMFAYAYAANPDTTNWDVSNITSFSNMFRDATSAVPNTSNWDLSSATDLSHMFRGASSANPDTSNWNISNVTSLHAMFFGASSANPNTSNWDVSNVTSMGYLFRDTTVANPDTGSWNVANVTDMSHMFRGAISANPNTASWDVSSVDTMYAMFYGASSANPDTSSWDVANVTSMSYMLYNALNASPNSANWDVGSVEDMSYMFRGATSADPNTASWDVSKVTDMSAMFYVATSVNPDTRNWDVSSVTSMQTMFYGASSANPNTDNWDVGNATNLSYMFYNATSADPNTSGWDVSNVSDTSHMFHGALSANPDISSWDVSGVTDMSNMFFGVTLPTASYDTVLNSFNSQTLQSGLNFHGGNSNYCLAETARANMIIGFNWIINDEGRDCDSTFLLEVLEDSASADGNNNANLIPISAAQLADITGLSLINPAYEMQYRGLIAAETSFSSPPTVAQVQDIINTVNTSQEALEKTLEDSVSAGGNNNGDGIAVTAVELSNIIGIHSVNFAHETYYQNFVATERNFTNPPTVAQVQTLIDAANIHGFVLESVLESSASLGNGNTNPTPISTYQLNALLGITAVNAEYESLYQKFIANETAFSNLPTVAQIQAVIDTVNTLASTDSDGDTLSDAFEAGLDSDGDGAYDDLDTDSDNDGLYDLIEALESYVTAASLDADRDGMVDVALRGRNATLNNTAHDADGDGVPDFRDRDSDNDGILDVVEAGSYDQDNDGRIDDSLHSADEVPEAQLILKDNSVPVTAHDTARLDQDGDTVTNARDLDSDNDGVADLQESSGMDSDHDGRIDNFSDANQDGVDDAIALFPLLIRDTDADGLLDYLDLDSDQDGVADILETGGFDSDADALVDNFSDSDSDGWHDQHTSDNQRLIDSDNDGVANFIDLDSDNDNRFDLIESGRGSVDSDNDGRLDRAADSDGDQIPDTVDVDRTNGVDIDGDGIDDRYDAKILGQSAAPDQDNDGIADEFDADPEGDGYIAPNADENSLFGIGLPDTDGDGVPDIVDGDDLEMRVETGLYGGGCTIVNPLEIRSTDPTLYLLVFISFFHYVWPRRHRLLTR